MDDKEFWSRAYLACMVDSLSHKDTKSNRVKMQTVSDRCIAFADQAVEDRRQKMSPDEVKRREEDSPTHGGERSRDSCPLPEDISGWVSSSRMLWHNSGWKINVNTAMSYHVTYKDVLVVRAPCRTLDGGLRLGIKAARRAWRLGWGRG